MILSGLAEVIVARSLSALAGVPTGLCAVSHRIWWTHSTSRHCKPSRAQQFVIGTESVTIHRMQKKWPEKEFIWAPTFDVMRMPG